MKTFLLSLAISGFTFVSAETKGGGVGRAMGGSHNFHGFDSEKSRGGSHGTNG